MKKTILLFLIASIFYNNANCQITEGNWLVGGNANISTQQETLNQANVTGWSIKVAPNIGYFFADKFAAGLKPILQYSSVKSRGILTKGTFLGFGPFFRYYFLTKDNRVNIFSEAAYQYGLNFHGYGQNDFSFSAGPVIYFNTSVGLEFTLNYDILNSKIANTTSTKTLSFGIGFQIHLEKDKN